MKINDTVICIVETSNIEKGEVHVIDDVTSDYIKVKGRGGYHLKRYFELLESKTESSGCYHKWKPIKGLIQTWYNCEYCDIKKEDYEKLSKEKSSSGSSFKYPDYDDWF